MERIVEVQATKISEIRGYMANSGQDCASGTCDCTVGCIDEALLKEFAEVDELFYS